MHALYVSSFVNRKENNGNKYEKLCIFIIPLYHVFRNENNNINKRTLLLELNSMFLCIRLSDYRFKSEKMVYQK